MKQHLKTKHQGRSCCGRGGARPGCGRKPGVKTRPVRLPEWLLQALEELGEPRHCIVKACIEQYGLEHPAYSASDDKAVNHNPEDELVNQPANGDSNE